MKRITLSILAGSIMFAFIYLIASFMNNSFNIGNWTEASRDITGISGGFGFIIIGGAIFENLKP